MRLVSGLMAIFAITLCLMLRGTHAASDVGPFYVNPTSRSVEIIFGLQCAKCTRNHVFDVVVPRTEIARIKAIDFIAVHDTTGKLVVDAPFTVKLSPAGGTSTDTVGRFTVPFTAPPDLERDNVFVFTGVVKFSSVSGIGTQIVDVTQADAVSEIAIVSYEAPAKEAAAHSNYVVLENNPPNLQTNYEDTDSGFFASSSLYLYLSDIATDIDGIYLIIESNTGGPRVYAFSMGSCYLNSEKVDTTPDTQRGYRLSLKSTLPKGLAVTLHCNTFSWGLVHPTHATVSVALIPKGTREDHDLVLSHGITLPTQFHRVTTHPVLVMQPFYYINGITIKLMMVILRSHFDDRDYFRIHLRQMKNIVDASAMFSVSVPNDDDDDDNDEGKGDGGDDEEDFPSLYRFTDHIKFSKGISESITYGKPPGSSPILALTIDINIEMKNADLSQLPQPLLEFVRHTDYDLIHTVHRVSDAVQGLRRHQRQLLHQQKLFSFPAIRAKSHTIHELLAGDREVVYQPLAREVHFDIKKVKPHIATFSIIIHDLNHDLFRGSPEFGVLNLSGQFWFAVNSPTNDAHARCTVNGVEFARATANPKEKSLLLTLDKPLPTNVNKHVITCPQVQFITHEDASAIIEPSRNRLFVAIEVDDETYVNPNVTQMNEESIQVWLVILLVILALVIVTVFGVLMIRRFRTSKMDETTEGLIQWRE